MFNRNRKNILKKRYSKFKFSKNLPLSCVRLCSLKQSFKRLLVSLIFNSKWTDCKL